MKPPKFLSQISPLPRVITEALRLVGVSETLGKADNPVIMEWRDELNRAGKEIHGFSGDEVPWCGLFVAIVCHRAGKEIVKEPLWARNWALFGVKSPKPSLGDVMVFHRGNGGHVAFYVGEDKEAYHVLGGNQSDSVNVTRIAKSRGLVACRRPIYKNMPATVKPYQLVKSGSLSSPLKES